MPQTADVIVIGAGMAGASAAAHLAESARVTLLEGEDQPGYHSTGRSAALFSETYGNLAAFEEGSRAVMKRLLDELPFWLTRWDPATAP